MPSSLKASVPILGGDVDLAAERADRKPISIEGSRRGFCLGISGGPRSIFKGPGTYLTMKLTAKKEREYIKILLPQE